MVRRKWGWVGGAGELRAGGQQPLGELLTVYTIIYSSVIKSASTLKKKIKIGDMQILGSKFVVEIFKEKIHKCTVSCARTLE